jgi:hypothetical protein
MARQKDSNSPFLYDNVTGDLVGFKDPDGSERYWVMHPYQPFEVKDAPTLSVVAPADSFDTLVVGEDSGKVKLTGAGDHDLTNANSVGKYVYIEWSDGNAASGFYEVLECEDESDELTIDLPYVSDTATITIADPAVVTYASHGLVAGTAVQFTTNDTLPTGITEATTYYVKTVLSANTFTVSDTVGGDAIATSGTQVGDHTITVWPGEAVVSVVDTDITLASVTIPGYTINVGMGLQLDILVGCTGSTNDKTVKAVLGGEEWYDQTFAANHQSLCVEKKACALEGGVIMSNALAAPGHGLSNGAVHTLEPTGGFEADQVFEIVVSIAEADEFVALEAWQLRINGT